MITSILSAKTKTNRKMLVKKKKPFYDGENYLLGEKQKLFHTEQK